MGRAPGDARDVHFVEKAKERLSLLCDQEYGGVRMFGSSYGDVLHDAQDTLIAVAEDHPHAAVPSESGSITMVQTLERVADTCNCVNGDELRAAAERIRAAD